jgi:hypothetical protein
MTLASILLLADRPSAVSSGAPLTLIIPLGLLLIALVVWYVTFRRMGGG